MISLKKQFRIYKPFTKSVIQKLMSYKLSLLGFVLGDIVKVFITFYLWKAIFSNSSSNTINGFSFDDMFVYVFMIAITSKLVLSNVSYDMGCEVKDGSIATNLIKPINYQLKFLFGNFGQILFELAFVSIPLWLGLITFRYFKLGEFPPDISTILLYLVSIFLGILISFTFECCFGLLSFYVTSIWGLSFLKGAVIKFFSGELIPIAFFPLFLQKFVSFVPFSSIVSTPVLIYLNKITGMEIIKALGVQLIWIGILFILNKWLWSKAIKRLTILGG